MTNPNVKRFLAFLVGLDEVNQETIEDDQQLPQRAERFRAQMSARIMAIAGVHRRLYTSHDVTVVDLKEYLGSLIEDLKNAMADTGRSHPVHLTCVPLSIPTDKAVSVGILVTELVTNAYKYAYPDQSEGDIRVDVTVSPSEVILTVKDDGVGLDSSKTAAGTGLGTRVMASMTASLAGTLEFVGDANGTRAVLRFPV
jgi:two-component sensor histidine kinase